MYISACWEVDQLTQLMLVRNKDTRKHNKLDYTKFLVLQNTMSKELLVAKCSNSLVTLINVFNVHGSVHRNNILVFNSNYMHKSRSLFYLTTALHVSGVTVTHLQEYKTTVTIASDIHYTVLLSAAIVEELELI
jgi:hypothetical protein